MSKDDIILLCITVVPLFISGALYEAHLDAKIDGKVSIPRALWMGLVVAFIGFLLFGVTR